MDTKKSNRPAPLRDDQIVTKRSVGRRAFLGILTAGSVGAVLAPGEAAAADVDNGHWTDAGSCPRGGGGVYTGTTDSDNGNITDASGYGRGSPYC